jgi:hypothetical protein
MRIQAEVMTKVVVADPLSSACAPTRTTTGVTTAERVIAVRQDLKNLE